MKKGKKAFTKNKIGNKATTFSNIFIPIPSEARGSLEILYIA